MLENPIETKVCAHAKSLGWLHYKFKSMSNKAIPDRIFIKGGVVLFIEFKRTGKRPSKLQLKVHKELREEGMNVSVVDDVNIGKHLFNVIESLGGGVNASETLF